MGDNDNDNDDSLMLVREVVRSYDYSYSYGNDSSIVSQQQNRLLVVVNDFVYYTIVKPIKHIKRLLS